MGNYRSKLVLTFFVALSFGASDSDALAQISGIDHYRSRLKTSPQPQSQRQPQPQLQRQPQPQLQRQPQSQQQFRQQTRQPQTRQRVNSRVRSTAYQLPVNTDSTPIYSRFRPQDSQSPQRAGARSPSSNRIATRVSKFSRALRRQIDDDPFGEEQVPNQIPTLDDPPVTSQPPSVPQVPPQDTNQGGIVLPPDVINSVKEPSILDGEDVVPGLKPDQKLPRPGLPNLFTPLKELRPQRRDPDQSAPDQSAPDQSEPDSIEKSDDLELDSSAYDPADPRHPNASNGPDSWYRPENQPPEPQQSTNYRGYAQPSHAQPGYVQPSHAQPGSARSRSAWSRSAESRSARLRSAESRSARLRSAEPFPSAIGTASLCGSACLEPSWFRLRRRLLLRLPERWLQQLRNRLRQRLHGINVLPVFVWWLHRSTKHQRNRRHLGRISI